MVKVISLSEDAYSKLKAIKGGRSFSEVVIEFTSGKKKRSILEFAGIWADDSEYWKNFEKEVRVSRDKAKLREVKF